MDQGHGNVDTVDSTASQIKANQDEMEFLRHLTLGIEEKLKKNRMIRDIKLVTKKPVEKSMLSCWERKYGVTLPPDLKKYYMSTNGFKLTWNLEHAGELLRIGEMNINQLNQVVQIETKVSTSSGRPNSMLEDNNIRNGRNFGKGKANGDSAKNESLYLKMTFAELQLTTMSGDRESNTGNDPSLSLGQNGRAFILDSGRSGWGKVCLVYPDQSFNSKRFTQVEPEASTSETKQEEGESESNPIKKGQSSNMEIWFLDSSFQWHYLAPTFEHYYRMLLIHLGLPQWQFRFTPYGLSGWAEQMFWLVAPHLLQPVKMYKFPSMYQGGGLWSADVPQDASTPNPSHNVLSTQIFRRKKKDKN